MDDRYNFWDSERTKKLNTYKICKFYVHSYRTLESRLQSIESECKDDALRKQQVKFDIDLSRFKHRPKY